MRVYDEDGRSLGKANEVEDPDFKETMQKVLAYDAMSSGDTPYWTGKFWYQDLFEWGGVDYVITVVMKNYDGGVDAYVQDSEDQEPAWWKKTLLSGIMTLDDEWWVAEKRFVRWERHDDWVRSTYRPVLPAAITETSE